MVCFNEFLKLFDVIGSKPAFTYKGSKRFKTVIGGLISIILYTICITGFLYFGSEIYLKNTPYIISGNTFNSDPSRMNFTSSTFPFLLGVQDMSNNYQYFKDEGIFRIRTYHYIRNTTIDSNGNSKVKVTKKEIFLEDCKLDEHFPGMESSFNSSNFKNAYCLPNSYKENLFIQGQQINSIYSYIQINVFACNNVTFSKCKSREEILKRIDMGYAEFQYGFYFFSPENFNSPLIRNRINYYTRIALNSQRRVTAQIKKLNYKTDGGYLIQDTTTGNYEQLDFIREQLNPENLKIDEPIFALTFIRSYNEDFTTRSYMKVQNLLAIMGGLYEMIKLIALYIHGFLFSHLFFIDIINDNFRSSNSLENFKQNKVEIYSRDPSMLELSKHKIMKIGLNTNDRSKYGIPINADVIDKYQKLKNSKPLNINTKSYVSHFIFSCFQRKINVEKAYYNKGKHLLKQRMNINLVLQRQLEHELLKYVILSENELKVFNSLPKPTLRLTINNDTLVPDPLRNINETPTDEQVLGCINYLQDNHSESKVLNIFENDFKQLFIKNN